MLQKIVVFYRIISLSVIFHVYRSFISKFDIFGVFQLIYQVNIVTIREIHRLLSIFESFLVSLGILSG